MSATAPGTGADASALRELAAAFAREDVSERKRMLVIANPHATTTSDGLKRLVVAALGSRYRVDAVDTERQGHATELCREAADEGYDVVTSLGGDGTVNEIANGLAGHPVTLTCLPGGATNVLCRMLGIPNDIVAATEQLLRRADDWRVRPMDLGEVNGRLFTFSAGLGLDASVVKRVDANPDLKRRLRQWYFMYAAISTFSRDYLRKPPRIEATAGGRRVEGVTVLVQNGDPYTYFGRRPVHVGPGRDLTDGVLDVAVLERAGLVEIPTISARLLSPRLRVTDHRHVTALAGVTEVHCRSTDGRPIPLQVDGDYIGDTTEATFTIRPGALTVVA